MKFRKKPIVIEAEQFLSFKFRHNDASDFLRKALCVKAHHGYQGAVHIHTLEGVHDVKDGDWIIKGVNGEFYPCKPDIFDKTYDVVPTNFAT